MTAVLLAPDSGTVSILRLLKAQNPTLLTEKWRIWSKRTAGEYLHLVLGVDSQSKAALQALNMTPHYGLGRARIHETSGEGAKARPGKGTEESQSRGQSQMTLKPAAANPEGESGYRRPRGQRAATDLSKWRWMKRWRWKPPPEWWRGRQGRLPRRGLLRHPP
uniref:DUF4780 domain-containing protein n=1 Tax=Bracon brevicornis TaxID=1563983 RepID=A0A6V7JIW8_9HYME